MRGVNLADEYDMDGVDEAFVTATGMSILDLPKVLLKFKGLGDDINDRYGSLLDTRAFQYTKDAIDKDGILDFDHLDTCAHVMFMLSTEEDLKVQDREEAGKLSKYFEELSNIVQKRASELEEEQEAMGIKTESLVTESEETPLGILEGMASALWASSWADHAEEHGCTSMSGQRIEDIMPPIPEEAYILAKKCADSIAAANGKSLSELFDDAVKADEADGVDSSDADESFGSDLAMQWMGHGVSWFDDHAEFPIKIPHGEAYELQMLADETCDVVDDEDDELDEETKDFLKGLDESSDLTDQFGDLDPKLAKNVKKWMIQNASNHENSTSLAEEAAQIFNLYEDKVDYVIPEIVFEMSAKTMSELGLEESKKKVNESADDSSSVENVLGDKRYTERSKFPKWNIMPTVLQEPRLFLKIFPELKKSDHVRLAADFLDKADTAELKYQAALNKASKQYGTEGSLISGGFREDWPSNVKDQIRTLVKTSQALKDAANAHAQAAKLRNMNEDADKGWDGLDKDQASSIAKGKSEKDKKTMYAVNHEDDGSYSVGEYDKKKSITVFKGGKEMVEEK